MYIYRRMSMNLVFIHGAGSSSKVWTYQKQYFSSHNVTLVELPGHGEKIKKNGRNSISVYVEDVKNDIADDAVIVGHSMGGAIAMMYALTYSLKALVLAGTGARLRVLPAILEQTKTNYEETIDFILKYAVYNKTEQIMRHSKEEMLKTPPEVTYKDFVACNTFDVMQEIKKIDVPTLVVCGSDDVLSPVKYSEYLARKIPSSHLEIIKECGHMLMLEKPHKFNQILETFLDEVSASQ
jgi:pimeloyl-ACP methyl ester carboxylesterase